MSRVYRIDNPDPAHNRLDVDGNSVLRDGETMTAKVHRDANGRMIAESCKCDANGKCTCPSQRADGSARTDATSEYARAIEETEQRDRNLAFDVLDGAVLEQARAELPHGAPVERQDAPITRGDAASEYARAIEETEEAGRSMWKGE